jgi:hypothetical protein
MCEVKSPITIDYNTTEEHHRLNDRRRYGVIDRSTAHCRRWQTRCICNVVELCTPVTY